METYRVKQLLLLTLLIGASPLQAQVNLATFEYWIDRQYQNHQTVNINGSLDHKIDISNLCNGIHTLEMRVSDTNGRWSSMQLKYFLKTDDILTNSHLAKYEYWIDDSTYKQTGTMTGENLQLDIDVSSLCKGVHTLVYQVQYDTGRKSSPRLVYFVVPDLEQGAGMIAAYEYWFNRGPRTRVELQPASPTVSLDNVIIEVKGVVPNSLEGYRFNAVEEQAEVDDNVFFGIQVYNADNHGSQAMTSDTFHMTVPVNLNMLILGGDDTPLTVEAPMDGRMQGIKSETAIGDSLVYTLSTQNVTADFYDATGNRLETRMEVLETGEAVYTLTATTARTYLLLYDAFDIRKDLSVSLWAQTASDISSTPSETATEVARYNIGGQTISSKQKGINIIRMSDGSVRKVIVK